MKKVLRGATVAGFTLAACAGFGSTAMAADADRSELPEVPSNGETEINILNDACVLPWFWQGPFNVLVENQDGSYSACNGSTEELSAPEAERILDGLPDVPEVLPLGL